MILLEGQRIYIRDHKQSDLDRYHRLLSDKESMFFLRDIGTSSREESEKSLADAISESQKGVQRQKFFLGIFLKDGTYLGEIGFTAASGSMDVIRRVHLGYFIHRDFWNKGYVSEAVPLVLDFAFNVCGIDRIETGCLCANRFSERIMIKFGFKRVVLKKGHVNMDDRWYDRVEYAMTRQEYFSILISK